MEGWTDAEFELEFQIFDLVIDNTNVKDFSHPQDDSENAPLVQNIEQVQRGSFETPKSFSKALTDGSLLFANASQLKFVLDNPNGYQTLLLVLLAGSISLQVLTFELCILKTQL